MRPFQRQKACWLAGPALQVILLSDGSVTRHLQLMTNQRVEVGKGTGPRLTFTGACGKGPGPPPAAERGRKDPALGLLASVHGWRWERPGPRLAGPHAPWQPMDPRC